MFCKNCGNKIVENSKLWKKLCKNKKNQTAEALPKEHWQNVSIIENNDELVAVSEQNKLMIANEHIQLRKTVANMLVQVSELLSNNLALYVIEGVRSIEEQQKRWDRGYKKIQIEFSDKDEAFWKKQIGLLVARPSPLANHNCGGAVDVQLFDKEKNDFVDMGTSAQSGFGYRATKMLSEEINLEQKQNRAVLRNVMEQVGFVWYPGEWWHYCYGDRMWAVYTKQTKCMYGPIQNIQK